MRLIQSLRTLFAKPPPLAPSPLPPEAETAEILPPEVTVSELQAELTTAAPPLLLDVREPYEWRQVRMSGALHIPMNDVPAHLAELPKTAAIVVVCAHGSRSYSVAAWLIEQGYAARSLAGGITEWAAHGGTVEMG